MSKYHRDRSFTDYVHQNLAMPAIYAPLGWTRADTDPEELQRIDMHEGIDYIFINEHGKKVGIQERFRDAFYKNYNDATLRFRRDCNAHQSRIESEFYKIRADYLVYGITNGKKFDDARHTLTGFLKWVILDLNFIRSQFESGSIKIVPKNANKCWISGKTLYCPENFNPDRSSSFIPFSLPLMDHLWGREGIRAQYGYF